MAPTPDLILRHAAQLVTLEAPPGATAAGARLGVVEDGAVVVTGERIAWVGATTDLPEEHAPGPDTRVVDVTGRVVLPGLVDAHTHLVWAGSRAAEFELRLEGASYEEIAARGGGILTTVRASRGASLEELVAGAIDRLDRMALWGVTTVEAKSGYGLDVEAELKLLQAIDAAGDLHPVDVVPTFLGAHSIPQEYRGRREAYVDLVVNEMLPAVAEAELASFCDVYVEPRVAFTIDEARRILEAGRTHGLFPKLHVDQLRADGGAELAAEIRAVSADHLDHVGEAGIAALAEAGVVGVLLPGATWFLRSHHHAPARRLLDAGVELAVATDCNPGTCPTESLPLCGSMACLSMGMTPAEALRAMTLGGARALGVDDEVGSLRPGKLADLLVLGVPDWRELVYHFGVPLADRVFKRGEEIVGGEPPGEDA